MRNILFLVVMSFFYISYSRGRVIFISKMEQLWLNFRTIKIPYEQKARRYILRQLLREVSIFFAPLLTLSLANESNLCYDTCAPASRYYSQTSKNRLVEAKLQSAKFSIQVVFVSLLFSTKIVTYLMEEWEKWPTQMTGHWSHLDA